MLLTRSAIVAAIRFPHIGYGDWNTAAGVAGDDWLDEGDINLVKYEGDSVNLYSEWELSIYMKIVVQQNHM